MAKILEMPKLSPTMEEGQLSVWHKKEGDAVVIDDLLAEVETDKATMEFRSFDKGTLLKLLVPAGSMVKLGQPVAIIGQPGEDISGLDTSGGGSSDQSASEGDAGQTDDQASDDQGDEPAGGDQAGGEGDQTGGEGDQAPPAGAAQPEGEQPAQVKGYEGQPPGGAKSSAQPRPAAPAGGQPATTGPASSPSARGYGSAAQADLAAQAKTQDKAADGGKPAAPKGEPAKGGPGDPNKSGSSGQSASGGSGQASGDRAAPARPAAAKASPSTRPPAPAGGDERVKASPYVRKLAREHDLDLHGVSGSGPAGRVVARDVTTLLEGGGAEASAPPAGASKPAAADRAASKPAADPGKGEGKPAARPAAAPGGLAAPEERPLSMMRKTIARRLTEAKQTVPHFYLTIDVDAGALAALREQINGELAAAARPGDEPTKVSLNDLLIKACAIALRRVPECNAQFTPEAILVHRRVDISVAVAVPEGLVTPVLRDADRLGLTAINSAVRDLATRAKAKKLAPDEMQNGTFSISNLGMFGIDEFAAVINPPEGAILAVGRVRDEPVVRDGAVVAGKRLGLTLSCDHRVIDGAVGARFLDALRGLIERPMQILVG